MFWLGMLVGAGVIILLEIVVVCIFGWALGNEMAEERNYWDNIVYPAVDTTKGEK